MVPDAFTEQAVQERAAFLEPSDLRVFFCYFQVFNSQCFSKLFGHFHGVLLGFTQCCWNLLSLRNRRQISKILFGPSWATLVGIVERDGARAVRISLSAPHLPGLTRKNLEGD